MKKQRLLKLVELLRKDARNKKGVRFDISVWAAPAGRRDFETEPEAPLPVSCGTSACAMGLAVISGAFKKQGLEASYLATYCGGIVMEPAMTVYGIRYHGFYAASKLFGIHDIEASYLFSAGHYPVKKKRGAIGERYVANRIAKFVRDGGVFLPNGKRPVYAHQLTACY